MFKAQYKCQVIIIIISNVFFNIYLPVLDLYFGGDSSTTASTQPHAYTCPYCARMGFTLTLLHEHVRTTHGDALMVEIVRIVNNFNVLY